jgi:hypothetical protein
VEGRGRTIEHSSSSKKAAMTEAATFFARLPMLISLPVQNDYEKRLTQEISLRSASAAASGGVLG